MPKPSDSNPGEFGLNYVKEILNAVIQRLKDEIDLFHLTSATSLTLGLVNGIDSLTKTILSFQEILPESSLT